MRQPIVKDFKSKTKAKALTSKVKDFIQCPQGASRPRPWPRGLHHWYTLIVCDDSRMHLLAQLHTELFEAFAIDYLGK